MRRAGDILRVFLDRHTADQAELYHSFFSAWEQVVGERIAAHSKVKDVENGIVLVEVDHPGWIQMIQIKQSQFVKSLRRRYPDLDIRGLRLQLPWKGPASAPKGSPETAPARRDSPAPTVAQTDGAGRAESGEEAAENPPDPLIRGALDRLGKAIEKRAEDR